MMLIILKKIFKTCHFYKLGSS